MAEEQKPTMEEIKAEEKIKERKSEQAKEEERVVRILSKDIEGKMSVYSGLTKIKGVSWSLANAICKKLGIDKKRKIGSLTDQEIQKITEFMKNPDLPSYLKNRRMDFETGEDQHLISADLDLKKQFDVKRLKNIKSYRGYRHIAGLPTKGQRTRSHFRKNKAKGAGIKKKKK
jgi:small subunit ribosomal protein S13